MQISGEIIMTEYCENCGEELNPEEESEGMCENCKISLEAKKQEENEEFIDPGIT